MHYEKKQQAFQKFYQKTKEERLKVLKQEALLTEDEYLCLLQEESKLKDKSNQIIENFLCNYEIPLGLATDFFIDGRYFVLPMATEEPSVIAAASFGAKTLLQGGGFQTKVLSRALRGQIVFLNFEKACLQNFEKEKEHFIESIYANRPSLKDYGKVIDLFYEIKEKFLIFYLLLDTGHAMGANLMNSVLESLAPLLEDFCKGEKLMAILSNHNTDSLVTASFHLPFACLANKKEKKTEEMAYLEGHRMASRIVEANELAKVDVFRACTHNKGIMNGIQAFVLASGNDTRAVEASVHSFAAASGQYQALTRYTLTEKGLQGEICLPLHLGILGGTIQNHPLAKMSLSLLEKQKGCALEAEDLARFCACLGLAQNLSALRALVGAGIQKGHMKLHARAVLSELGASEEEIAHLLPIIEKEKIHQRKALEMLFKKEQKEITQ